MDRYLDRLPKYAFDEDVLYLRPMIKTPLEGPWYHPVPIGKNKLGSMTKEMCEEAGLPPRTNHSLRATGATTLFQANVPERIIQKTTGHRSLDSLRTYERISAEQHQAVSKVMMSGEKKSYVDEIEKVSASSSSSSSSSTSYGRLFGDLTHCTIGRITINIQPTITADDEYDEIVKNMNLD